MPFCPGHTETTKKIQWNMFLPNEIKIYRNTANIFKQAENLNLK